MANKNLFQSASSSQSVPAADTVNEAGGKAYKMESKHALAQFVSTSCLNGTFYTSDKDQLEIVKKLMVDCDPEFLGKLAVYGRQVSFMKDMPSLLCAYLAGEVGKAGVKSETQDRKTAVLRKIFPHVIDNGKMLCNFVQMVRSGQFGRKNMGHCASKLVSEWFESRSPASIFRQSIGNNPSLGDVIKLTRPKPNTPEKAALFAYLCGSKIETDGEGGKHLRSYYKDIKDNTVKLAHQHPFGALPEIVLEYEAWKADRTRPTPKLDFRFLDNEPLTKEQWRDVARNASWKTTMYNMNSFTRNGVFEDQALVDIIAARLANAEEVAKANVFPYQILVAYLASEGKVPSKVRDALHDAMEAATKNVPTFENRRLRIMPDVSGSMTTARVTGTRDKGTDKNGKEWDTSTMARCIDVAALFTASLLRTNRDAEVLPFEIGVVPVARLSLEPRDTVMTNAKKLASIGGGGTNCAAPMNLLNQRGDRADVLVYISDYESWFDGPNSTNGKATELMNQWKVYKSRNPSARLVCIDLTPRANGQVQQREDILQVGGFSDNVFSVVSRFVAGGWNKDFWVKEIESIDLDNLQ